MNAITPAIAVSVAKIFFVGILIGFLVSLFTVIMIKKMARRTERYELTYVPMTLVESKLWKCAFIAYPLLISSLFIAAFVVMELF